MADNERDLLTTGEYICDLEALIFPPELSLGAFLAAQNNEEIFQTFVLVSDSQSLSYVLKDVRFICRQSELDGSLKKDVPCHLRKGIRLLAHKFWMA